MEKTPAPLCLWVLLFKSVISHHYYYNSKTDLCWQSHCVGSCKRVHSVIATWINTHSEVKELGIACQRKHFECQKFQQLSQLSQCPWYWWSNLSLSVYTGVLCELCAVRRKNIWTHCEFNLCFFSLFVLRWFLGDQVALNLCMKSTPLLPIITSKYT